MNFFTQNWLNYLTLSSVALITSNCGVLFNSTSTYVALKTCMIYKMCRKVAILSCCHKATATSIELEMDTRNLAWFSALHVVISATFIACFLLYQIQWLNISNLIICVNGNFYYKMDIFIWDGKLWLWRMAEYGIDIEYF